MLKGKQVLTENFYGIVLNDAEHEQLVVLHVTRERRIRRNDTISQMAGWEPVSTWWVASNRTIHITHAQLGPFEVWERMPKWLHARNLNQDSGRPLTTVINGRRYVDW